MSIDAVPRIARRRRQRRARGLLTLALAATVGVGTWLIVRSPALGLQVVDVQLHLNPTSSLTRGEVLQALEAPMGTPLIDLNLGRMQQHVASLPDVASVSLQRQWPHALLVEVTARRAVAVLRCGDTDQLLDAHGRAFAAAGGVPAHLPVLPFPWACGPEPLAGLRLKRAVAEIMSVPAPWRQSMTAVADNADTGLTFRLGGNQITWGTAAGAAIKAQEVRATLSPAPHHRSAAPTDIDVSAVGIVVTHRQHKSG